MGKEKKEESKPKIKKLEKIIDQTAIANWDGKNIEEAKVFIENNKTEKKKIPCYENATKIILTKHTESCQKCNNGKTIVKIADVNLSKTQPEIEYPNLRGYSKAPNNYFLIHCYMEGNCMPEYYPTKCEEGKLLNEMIVKHFLYIEHKDKQGNAQYYNFDSKKWEPFTEGDCE